MTRNMSTDFRQQTISLFSVTGSHWILTVQCLVSADPVSWYTGLVLQRHRRRTGATSVRARSELGCRPVNRPVNKLLILMEDLRTLLQTLVDFLILSLKYTFKLIMNLALIQERRELVFEFKKKKSVFRLAHFLNLTISNLHLFNLVNQALNN